MDNYMIAFVLLLVIIFISRAINERANKQLEQDKKALLIDLFSKDRIYTYGVLIIIIVWYFLSLKYKWVDPFITYVIYIILILSYLLGTSILAYKKLKKNGFPDFYIKSYLLTVTLRVIGLVIFFVIIGI